MFFVKFFFLGFSAVNTSTDSVLCRSRYLNTFLVYYNDGLGITDQNYLNALIFLIILYHLFFQLFPILEKSLSGLTCFVSI